MYWYSCGCGMKGVHVARTATCPTCGAHVLAEPLAPGPGEARPPAATEARRRFDRKKGNNHEATATARGLLDFARRVEGNLCADMHLRLTAGSEAEDAFLAGGPLAAYRQSVKEAVLTARVNVGEWSVLRLRARKQIVAILVTSLLTLYPNACAHVTVRVRQGDLADGASAMLGHEPIVTLRRL